MADDTAGNPDNGRMGRHRGHEHRAGTDPAVATDRDRAENGRAAEDRHRVFDGRMALDWLGGRTTECNALIDRYVIADFAGLANDDAHAMIDKAAPADFRAGMNLNSCQESSDVAYETRKRDQLALPEPVRDPVDENRVKTRIGYRNFPNRPGRRIALEYCLNIFFERLPHGQ